MATVSAKVFERHKKTDGTINVKIIVYHKNERKLVSTPHFVVSKQLTNDLKIKDKFLLRIIDDTLDNYRETISQLWTKLDFFTCEALRDHLRDKDVVRNYLLVCFKCIHDKIYKLSGKYKNMLFICFFPIKAK